MTFHELLAALLPRPYDVVALASELAAEGAALDAVQASAINLRPEFSPESTERLIDRWEAWMGLPCHCCSPSTDTSLSARQARLARAYYATGQTRTLAFFRDVLDEFGFESVTVSEFDVAWRLRVAVPDTAFVGAFAAGSGSAGQALRTWQSHPVECVMRRNVPAHIRYVICWADVSDTGDIGITVPEIDSLHTAVHVVYPAKFGA